MGDLPYSERRWIQVWTPTWFFCFLATPIEMTLFFSISFSDSSSKMHFLIASGITEIQVHISFCCIFKSPVKNREKLRFPFSKAAKTFERGSQVSDSQICSQYSKRGCQSWRYLNEILLRQKAQMSDYKHNQTKGTYWISQWEREQKLLVISQSALVYRLHINWAFEHPERNGKMSKWPPPL